MPQKLHIGSVCLSCKSKKSLKPLILIEKFGDHPKETAHQIAYSHIVLAFCQSCKSGQIEALDHDCFDWEEVWDQYEWYLINKDDIVKLKPALKNCDNPLSPDCKCEIHKSLLASIRKFPKSSWSAVFEAPGHTHKVKVKIRKGVPELVV